MAVQELMCLSDALSWDLIATLYSTMVERQKSTNILVLKVEDLSAQPGQKLP